MPISALSGLIGRLLSIRRDRVVDKRASLVALALELDELADLLSSLLDATFPNGQVDRQKAKALDAMRVRNWNRWTTILETPAYTQQDPDIKAEIERCVEIAHAAPGSYIEEILLVQISLSEGVVPVGVRERFSRSIDRIRDLTTKLRLDV